MYVEPFVALNGVRHGLNGPDKYRTLLLSEFADVAMVGANGENESANLC